MSLIQPRTLKGFRDYLPEVMIPRERMMETARHVFRSFGFAPIDTPVLEYLEILTGKGSDETDRQIYRFEDNGGREVGMRFDLTVPLARFAAQHIGTLGKPFKRYHIAPVWRGENPQAGRYREFVQCDFDTIATESVLADIEAVAVINRLLESLGFDRFTISLNNRTILTGLLEGLGLSDATVPILRSLDKLAKIGRDKTMAEMVSAAGVTEDQAKSVLRLADCNGTAEEIFAMLPEVTGGNESAAAGIDRLQEIYRVPLRRVFRHDESNWTCRSLGAWITTRASSLKRRWMTSAKSEASVAAGVMTTWLACTPSSTFQALAHHSVWIACWRRWRS